MSLAFRCEPCGGEPRWQVVRVGDVVVSWACDDHLVQVCTGLQRDFEVTELIVKHSPKAREWAEISRTLGQIAKDAGT